MVKTVHGLKLSKEQFDAKVRALKLETGYDMKTDNYLNNPVKIFFEPSEKRKMYLKKRQKEREKRTKIEIFRSDETNEVD